MNPSIPQNKLASILAQRLSMTPEEADRFITEFFRLGAESMKESGGVDIKSFGKFHVSAESVEFFPAEEVADTVNEPFSFFESVELKENVTKEILEEATSTAQTEASAINDRISPETAVESSDELGNHNIPAMPQRIDPLPSEDSPAAPDEAETIESSPVGGSMGKKEESEEKPSADGSDRTEPEVIYETVYQTRPWPVILGVVLGVIVGFIIGFLVSGAIKTSSGNTLVTNETVTPEDIDGPTATVADSISENVLADTLRISPDTVSANISTRASEKEPEVAVVYDTVTPHRFLATMAREHYGVMEYWIFIYEENRSSLPANPNRITPGTRVIIPPVDKYVPSGDRTEGRKKAAGMIRQLEKNL